MLDALLERALGARAYVLDRHALLQRRNTLDRAQLAALLGHAALDDARLVEMDVDLDQSGTGEVSAGVVNLGLGGEPALDGDDAALLNADIQRSVGEAIGQARVADDEVHESALAISTRREPLSRPARAGAGRSC